MDHGPFLIPTEAHSHWPPKSVAFIFFIFYFYFLQKYIFDLEIYRNILRPLRCRTLAARQQGGMGVFEIKFRKKNYAHVLEAGPRPAGRWRPVLVHPA